MKVYISPQGRFMGRRLECSQPHYSDKCHTMQEADASTFSIFYVSLQLNQLAPKLQGWAPITFRAQKTRGWPVTSE